MTGVNTPVQSLNPAALPLSTPRGRGIDPAVAAKNALARKHFLRLE